MKPVLIQHTQTKEQTLWLQHNREANFRFPWHYHPEMELTWVLSGEGMRFVGDSLERFQAGDMVLLGANVPHLWKNSEVYYDSGNTLEVEAIIIHFQADALKAGFGQLPEAKFLDPLFHRSLSGLSIQGNTHNAVGEKLRNMLHETHFKQLLSLIELLEVIASSNECRPLASPIFQEKYFIQRDKRFQLAYNYIMERFQQPLTLEEVAAVASLSPTAFCRFFKKQAGKTYSQFLKETRISYASRLLTEAHYSIAQVAFESGYNNLSNFNQHFKEIHCSTPRTYREKLR